MGIITVSEEILGDFIYLPIYLKKTPTFLGSIFQSFTFLNESSDIAAG